MICALIALAACSEQSTPEPAGNQALPAPPASPASTADVHGETLYEQHCSACHDTGLEGAPAIDHAPSWAQRSPEWSAVLKQHAIDGSLAMPPRGASPQLSDAEVGAAVEYMRTRIMPPSLLAAGSAQGRLFYQTTCSRCHDSGVDGAPIIGDSAAWAARSMNWHTVMQDHASNGFVGMPAKGDELQLFSEDVAAAVAFMVAWAKHN